MRKVDIKIGSVITPDILDIVYISMNSIKQNKKASTKIDYYILIKYTFTYDEYYCKRKISSLESDDFKIHYIDANPYIKEINTQGGFSDVLFVRCLFPKIFPKLDKILYLDTDVFCLKEGIEEFWNTELEDNYVAAVIDPLITWNPRCCKDYHNTQTKTYFNAGVLLLNLAKIKEDKLDDTLQQWTKEWNYYYIGCILHDQTLLNYFFRGHVKVMSPIWNNMLLIASKQAQKYFAHNLTLYEFNEPLKSLDSTVFVHFCTRGKPWNAGEMTRADGYYYYVKELLALWNDIVNKYGKSN